MGMLWGLPNHRKGRVLWYCGEEGVVFNRIYDLPQSSGCLSIQDVDVVLLQNLWPCKLSDWDRYIEMTLGTQKQGQPMWVSYFVTHPISTQFLMSFGGIFLKTWCDFELILAWLVLYHLSQIPCLPHGYQGIFQLTTIHVIIIWIHGMPKMLPWRLECIVVLLQDIGHCGYVCWLHIEVLRFVVSDWQDRKLSNQFGAL
jgi:hypothetical protein